jgi:hypothetical protein
MEPNSKRIKATPHTCGLQELCELFGKSRQAYYDRMRNEQKVQTQAE